MAGIVIRPFQPADQAEVKALILAGLVEHWGVLDPARNPDLDDIASSYQAATFLVAWHGEQLVGTGALIPRGSETAEIVRMSVRRDHRRQRVGRLILEELVECARSKGFHRVILETTAEWVEVVEFYLNNGFQITHYQDGDVYFAYDLG